MSKQTAVEWLIQQLFGDSEIIGCSDELLNQAKEMEKEQIIDACLSNKTTQPVIKKLFEMQAEKYYNDTYKGGNK
jgi:hypothetical protein